MQSYSFRIFKNNFIRPSNNKPLQKSLLFLSQYREDQIQGDYFLVEKNYSNFYVIFANKII